MLEVLSSVSRDSAKNRDFREAQAPVRQTVNSAA